MPLSSHLSVPQDTMSWASGPRGHRVLPDMTRRLSEASAMTRTKQENDESLILKNGRSIWIKHHWFNSLTIAGDSPSNIGGFMNKCTMIQWMPRVDDKNGLNSHNHEAWILNVVGGYLQNGLTISVKHRHCPWSFTIIIHHLHQPSSINLHKAILIINLFTLNGHGDGL